MNRREFLTRSIQTAIAGSSLTTATIGHMNLVNAMMPVADDYRCLVCVFLFGGNDSYNMVVPAAGPEYQAYADARQTLAVAAEDLVPISTLSGSGPFGFHPAAPELADLFNLGKLAVVANVGALVEPTTRPGFEAGSIALPQQLFSHNDQQKYWQSFDTTAPQPTGWAGRMADLLLGVNGETPLSMNITIAGSNLWQTGAATIPYSIGAQGLRTLNALNREAAAGQERRRAEAFHNLLTGASTSIFGQEFAAVQQRSIELANTITDLVSAVPPLETQFPANNPLAASLSMVSRLIGARDALGIKRQTFFVALGGWDTHGDQLSRHPILFSRLSQGLFAFQQALEEMGISDRVTTFTASDFDRTLTSNGDGSDHGWGGHHLVMGNAVAGREVYGNMPVIEIDGPQDSGRGRIIPSTAIDQMGADLAGWFGLMPSELDEVFPNLRNFSERLNFMNLS